MASGDDSKKNEGEDLFSQIEGYKPFTSPQPQTQSQTSTQAAQTPTQAAQTPAQAAQTPAQAAQQANPWFPNQAAPDQAPVYPVNPGFVGPAEAIGPTGIELPALRPQDDPNSAEYIPRTPVLNAPAPDPSSPWTPVPEPKWEFFADEQKQPPQPLPQPEVRKQLPAGGSQSNPLPFNSLPIVTGVNAPIEEPSWPGSQPQPLTADQQQFLHQQQMVLQQYQQQQFEQQQLLQQQQFQQQQQQQFGQSGTGQPNSGQPGPAQPGQAPVWPTTNPFFDQPIQQDQFKQLNQTNQFNQPSQFNQPNQFTQPSQFNQPDQFNQFNQPGTAYGAQADAAQPALTAEQYAAQQQYNQQQQLAQQQFAQQQFAQQQQFQQQQFQQQQQQFAQQPQNQTFFEQEQMAQQAGQPAWPNAAVKGGRQQSQQLPPKMRSKLLGGDDIPVAPPSVGLSFSKNDILGIATYNLNVTREILTNPKQYFENLPLTGGYGEPLLYTIFTAIFSALIFAIGKMNPFWFFGGLIIGFISVTLGSVIVDQAFRRLGGKGDLEGTFRVLAYSKATFIISWIALGPLSLGMMLATLVTGYMNYIGLMRVQGLSPRSTLIIVGVLSVLGMAFKWMCPGV